MKLSLDTYSIGQDLTMRELLELLPACGYDGVEFRSESGQAHGVEPEIGAAQRREIRALLDAAGLEISCISTSQRYESPSPSERAIVIDRVKQFIDLAADIRCPAIRTFGNDFPPGVAREEVVKYVGESLRTVGEYAEDKGVTVLLEMHGQFYYWEYCLNAVKIADHPNVAINYNCDEKDIVDGSISFTFNQVKDHVKHVHVHDMEKSVLSHPEVVWHGETIFPCRELFGILKGIEYPHYCSLEQTYREGGEKKVISLYASLFRALWELS
jgi:sugar phosphate isomerase/epimerase